MKSVLQVSVLRISVCLILPHVLLLQSPEDQRRSSKRPTTGKARINFVSAKQRQISSKASSRAKTRGRELLQIIELDRVAYDLFDMPPVGEYELYMRTFGRSDTKQVRVKTIRRKG